MSSEYPAKEIPANTPDYFCSSCGTRLKSKASFCTECGTVVQAIQHAPTTIPTGTHPPKANRTLMIIGLVFISIGIMAAIGAGLLFFITMGWLYLQAIILAGVGGGFITLGGILLIVHTLLRNL